MSNSEIINSLSDGYAANIIGVLETRNFYHREATTEGREVVANETLEGLNEALTELGKDNILNLDSAKLFLHACAYLNTYHKERSNSGTFVLINNKIKYIS